MNLEASYEHVQAELTKYIQLLEYKNKFEQVSLYFPDEDTTVNGKKFYARAKYKKHLKFFEAGKSFSARLFMAGNQIGKSTASIYETVCHLTGLYPEWWQGHRFDKPIKAWCVGYNSDTLLKLWQNRLLGPVGDFGTGMIPRHCIDFDTLKEAKKADTPVASFRVKHITGGYSTVELKAYLDGRRAFEGDTIDLVTFDEEPPIDIYSECVTRTIATGGKIMMNFTPLLGMSEVILNFTNQGDWSEGMKSIDNFLVNCEQDDVPHLTKEDIERIRNATPEHLREARRKGIPVIGAGQVYCVSEDKVFIDFIEIPKHWKRVFAMDFGFTAPCAILWAAINPDDQTVYIYSEHYVKGAQLIEHVNAIKARNSSVGYNIPGVCDPSGGGRGIHDGEKSRELMQIQYSIDLVGADNSIMPGIMKVQDWLNTSKIKIFKSCTHTLSEYRLYRFDPKGKLQGQDHAMDALRYLIMSGIQIASREGSTSDDIAGKLLAARQRHQDGMWNH